MEETLDFSRTQRIVFFIDLHPLFHLQNPNSYISSVLATARKLLTFKSLSSSLFAFKFFFSSLSPLRSTSKVHSLVGKSAASFSFNHPSETLISLSEILSSLSPIVGTVVSPPRASLTVGSLRQLMHDYAWETQSQDLVGTPEQFYVRSNLVLLFSPAFRSLECLSKYVDIEDSNRNLVTEEAFCEKNWEIFRPVKEVFVSRDIHLSWINVNDALEPEEEEVEKDQVFSALGCLQKGVKSLQWGFCSTNAIILGSSIIPLGLIYPNMGYSLMSSNLDDCRKGVRADLSLEISDVSGKPLECKYCELELLNLNILYRKRSLSISDILEPLHSTSESCDQGRRLFGDIGNRISKICIREVMYKNEIVKFKDSISDFFLVRAFSRGKKEGQSKDGSDVFLVKRVLDLLQVETSDLAPCIPHWQLLLTLLYRRDYCAQVTISNCEGIPMTGILIPFTVNSAFLCILDARSSSVRHRNNPDLSSSYSLVVAKVDVKMPKADGELNNLGESAAYQKRASNSSISQNSRVKRNRKSLKFLQDLTWSSFCEAALGHSEMDLEDVYFAREGNNSKKLKFFKCWMKQIKRPTCYVGMEPNELSTHLGVKGKMEKQQFGSEQESEQPVSSSFSAGEASFPLLYNTNKETHACQEISLPEHSNMNKETHACREPSFPLSPNTNKEKNPPCQEASESFFSSISEKIHDSLISEDVDLSALAEWLVNSSIHWLYWKHQSENTVVNLTPEKQPQAVPNAIVAADLLKLLLKEPKDLALKYKGCNPPSLASDSSSSIYTSAYKVREYELQILFRMEILQSKVGTSIGESAKQKTVKQICTLLEIVQCHLAGGFFGDSSLDAYVRKTIKRRYSHSIGDVVHRIYKKMDLLLFDDEEEAPASLNNSEDREEVHKETVDENEVGENYVENVSAVAGKSSKLQKSSTKTHHVISKDEHKHKLLEARERRERARRFASFTSWIPNLQRVWAAPKQPSAHKAKSDCIRKTPKWRNKRGAHYDVVCETPPSEKKRSRMQIDWGVEGKSNSENHGNASVSKSLFQDDSDSIPSSTS